MTNAKQDLLRLVTASSSCRSEIVGEHGQNRAPRHLVAEARKETCQHDREECVRRQNPAKWLSVGQFCNSLPDLRRSANNAGSEPPQHQGRTAVARGGGGRLCWAKAMI